MKIARYRKDFDLVILESKDFDVASLQNILVPLQYHCQHRSWLDVQELIKEPPHILLVYWEVDRVDVERALRELHEELPETHVILLTPLHDLAESFDVFGDVIYDSLPWPMASADQIVKAVDRAAERDYFMYRCEQNGLVQEPEGSLSVGPNPFSSLDVFLDKLYQAQSLEEVVGQTFNRLEEYLPHHRFAFFKYFSNRRSLVLFDSRGFNHLNLKGVGVNLNEREDNFKVQDLRDLKGLGIFVEMVKKVFDADRFEAELMESSDGPLGVFVFFDVEPPLAAVPEVSLLFRHVRAHLRMIEFERRLHVVSSRDEATDVLHRQSFMEALHQEIARARRIQLPVSLILLKVDQLPLVMQQMGREEGDLLLKMVAKIFRKHSRVNDIVGRTGSDEFGLLLPHTPHQGAAIKAERLRRIIESADFTRLLRGVKQVTISCGVSEYPSLCRDADELLVSADAALFEVIKANMNRVCLASVPSGFVADFVVNEPTWLFEGRRSGA